MGTGGRLHIHLISPLVRRMPIIRNYPILPSMFWFVLDNHTFYPHDLLYGRYLLASIAAYVVLAWSNILNEENGERYFVLLNACGIFVAGPLAWLIGDDTANLHGSAIVIFVLIGATTSSSMVLPSRSTTNKVVASIRRTLDRSNYRAIAISVTAFVYAVILSALYMGKGGCARVGNSREYVPNLKGPTSWTGNLCGLLTGIGCTIMLIRGSVDGLRRYIAFPPACSSICELLCHFCAFYFRPFETTQETG